jgi:hypothetical protein
MGVFRVDRIRLAARLLVLEGAVTIASEGPRSASEASGTCAVSARQPATVRRHCRWGSVPVINQVVR